MYVGDSPAHDIAPAKSLGMLTAFARRASRWTPSGEEQEADSEADAFEEDKKEETLKSLLSDS